MIKTDKPSFTYKSFKEDSSILFRQIIDLAVENSSLEFDYPKESYNYFSPVCLDIKNCKILVPDHESGSYAMKTNWDRNSIIIGYINDFSFAVTETEDDGKIKIKAEKEEFKAEVHLKLLNSEPENNTPFGFDLESDFYRQISKGFSSYKKQELFKVSLDDCFLSYSFLFWISESKCSNNHPLLKYYFNLFLNQSDTMDFNNFPIDYRTKNLLKLSKNYLSKDERAFLQEKIIKSFLEKLEKNSFDEDLEPLEVLSNLFCEIYREIDGIDAKRFFELIKLEKVNFNFIYRTSGFMKKNDFVEFLQLIKSETIKFDNYDTFKFFISKNSYLSMNEIRDEINFIFEVINRISSTNKKVNIFICISSQFEELELSMIEDLLKPIYKLKAKKLIKLEKV